MSAERLKPNEKRPRVGHVLAARFGTQVQVGPKGYYPNNTVIDGKEGWRLEVDWERQGVWVGHGAPMHWAFVPMSNAQYLGLEIAEEEAKP